MTSLKWNVALGVQPFFRDEFLVSFSADVDARCPAISNLGIDNSVVFRFFCVLVWVADKDGSCAVHHHVYISFQRAPCGVRASRNFPISF